MARPVLGDAAGDGPGAAVLRRLPRPGAVDGTYGPGRGCPALGRPGARHRGGTRLLVRPAERPAPAAPVRATRRVRRAAEPRRPDRAARSDNRRRERSDAARAPGRAAIPAVRPDPGSVLRDA